MIVDCLSDTHGNYPQLEGGDLLIISGDLTARDTHYEYRKFLEWLIYQKYFHKIIIGGNHDNFLESNPDFFSDILGINYLFDSGTEFGGPKVWGSPWSLTFPGMNPKCKAFTVDTEEELAEKWQMIPEDVDILITHTPPYGILDSVIDEAAGFENEYRRYCGSTSLQKLLYGEKLKPRLHVFGHIHEGYGTIQKMMDYPHTHFINCSYVNERYEPVNKPVRVIL